LTEQSYLEKSIYYLCCEVLLNNYIDMNMWFRKIKIFPGELVLVTCELCQPLLAPHITDTKAETSDQLTASRTVLLHPSCTLGSFEKILKTRYYAQVPLQAN
jgi:hypothetical protein